MIYWLKKLEWKIRKGLGLQKKRVRTIDDVTTFNQELFFKLIILIFAVILVIRVGEGLAQLWWWFFPPRHWLPTEYL